MYKSTIDKLYYDFINSSGFKKHEEEFNKIKYKKIGKNILETSYGSILPNHRVEYRIPYLPKNMLKTQNMYYIPSIFIKNLSSNMIDIIESVDFITDCLPLERIYSNFFPDLREKLNIQDKKTIPLYVLESGYLLPNLYNYRLVISIKEHLDIDLEQLEKFQLSLDYYQVDMEKNNSYYTDDILRKCIFYDGIVLTIPKILVNACGKNLIKSRLTEQYDYYNDLPKMGIQYHVYVYDNKLVSNTKVGEKIMLEFEKDNSGYYEIIYLLPNVLQLNNSTMCTRFSY